MEVPQEESYDGYLQLENGVGMLRLLFDEFEEAFGKLTGDDRVEERFRCNGKAGVSVCRQDGTADAGEVSGAEDPYVLY